MFRRQTRRRERRDRDGDNRGIPNARGEDAVREDGVEPSVRAGRRRPRSIPNPSRRQSPPRRQPRRRRRGTRRGGREGSISSGREDERVVGVVHVRFRVARIRIFAVGSSRVVVVAFHAARDATKPRVRALRGSRATDIVRTRRRRRRGSSGVRRRRARRGGGSFAVQTRGRRRSRRRRARRRAGATAHDRRVAATGGRVTRGD